MESDEHIVRYTAEELEEMIRRGENQTDWARVAAMTDEELEASIDSEDEGEFDLSQARIGIPGLQRQVTIHLDSEVIDWFKAQGADCQTRINAGLRSYVDAQRTEPAATPRR